MGLLGAGLAESQNKKLGYRDGVRGKERERERERRPEAQRGGGEQSILNA